MKIKIIVVGKIKESSFVSHLQNDISYIKKRCNISIIELNDESIPNNCSEKSGEKILDLEGQKIYRYIDKTDYVVTMAIEGIGIDSDQFKNILNEHKNIVFIIGGSLGVSSFVKAKSDLLISFSKMTFTHQFMRVLLVNEIKKSL